MRNRKRKNPPSGSKLSKETPLFKQYKEIKAKYPDEILLFRIGDFYETFLEDAKVTSKALGIALTSKPLGKGIRVPLAGIPVKAAETYIAKLLKQGYRVAICEQIGEPGKGLMHREVVEVITPGTVFSPSLLDDKKFNYIAAYLPDEHMRLAGVAVAELTTGDFFVFEADAEQAVEELRKLNVAELLVPEDIEIEGNWALTPRNPIDFSPTDAEDELKRFFGVSTLEGFGIRDMDLAVRAARGLIAYIKDKKPGMVEHIHRIRVRRLSEFMYLDARTIANLELLEPIRVGEGMSLLKVLDYTRTPMGGRRLREALVAPFAVKKLILERQSRVNAFFENPQLMKKTAEILKDFYDIERAAARISAGRLNPRELLRIGQSIMLIPKLKKLLAEDEFLDELASKMPNIADIGQKILDTIVEDPPSNMSDGGVVKSGVSQALDELRYLAQHGKEKLLELEQREKIRTGIPTLRIGYNNVFGYYIEVSKSYANRVPKHYIRKQTLTNVERYYTDELKRLEEKILGAEERAVRLEQEIVNELRGLIAERIDDFKSVADIVAEIDLDLSLAEVARRNRYTRPEIVEDGIISIKDGRHPVVEVMSQEPFIPNDTEMDLQENMIFIITGPNMSGKSTYLRQVAMITILAQMGGFVPAASAKIGIVDRIFTRIGASDDLARGVSTFMAEMIETAEILHNATRKSLIILDEVGRGTSTYDGIAIAWAVVEYLATRVKAKALFATHYHELSELGKRLSGVKNYTVAVKEWQDEVIFLRKVVPGETDRSYGIYVAKLAGLPMEVIRRAWEILEQLERRGRALKPRRSYRGAQLSFFQEIDPIRRKIMDLDLDSMTPREALEFLYKIKEEIGK